MKMQVLDGGAAVEYELPGFAYADFDHAGPSLSQFEYCISNDGHKSNNYLVCLRTRVHVQFDFVSLQDAYRYGRLGDTWISTACFKAGTHSISIHNHTMMILVTYFRSAVEKLLMSRRSFTQNAV